MQLSNLSTLDDEFRRRFKELDDSVLICPAEWAALSRQSRASVYTARTRGLLPSPVMEKNRLVRWTAGQYRDWARALTEPTSGARGGRPRSPIKSAVGTPK